MHPSPPDEAQQVLELSTLHDKRILITGGAGFIGSWLSRMLVSLGANVYAADNLSTGTRKNLELATESAASQCELVDLDIRRPESVSRMVETRPDFIVHLAAQPRVVASVQDIWADAATNILGTINVLEVAVRAAATRIVIISSGGTIYGSHEIRGKAVDEASERQPISPYGISKATGDSYTTFYGSMFGLEHVTLALGNVYGPRFDGAMATGAIPGFTYALQSGMRPTIYGNGRQTRDFVHVTDVARAICLAMTNPAARNGFFNIGSGQATSIEDVYAMVGDAVGRQIEPTFQPSNPFEVDHIVLDTLRAKRVLGWEPLVALRDGITSLASALASEGAVQTDDNPDKVVIQL